MPEKPRRRMGATRADIPFGVLAIASGVALLYLGRSLTFFHDEWRSITFDGGLIDYFRPVNEHWSTFPLLLYRSTFAIVELHSYLPYLAELILLHLVAVAGAYAVIRSRLGPLVATLFVLPLLLLGSGAENLFWAFQTGFVGSVMFGAWALFFIERTDRSAPVVASALLVAALASSGIGLFFLVAAAARTLFDESLRSRVLAVVPPAAIYVLWFTLVGHGAVGETGPLVVDVADVTFAVRGITFSTETALGLQRLPEGYLLGLLLFIGLVVVVGVKLVRLQTASPLATACLLGIASMYTLVALVRAHLQFDYATASRYVYVAAFFLALAVADLLPRRESWTQQRKAVGIVIAIALGLGLTLSTTGNVDYLDARRSEFQAKADLTRAFIALEIAHADASWVDQNARLGVMPTVSELLETVRRHGSPLEDRLVPGVVTRPGVGAEETALLTLVGDRFALEPVDMTGAPVGMDVVASHGLALTDVRMCIRATAIDDAGALTVSVPGGARIRLSSSSAVEGNVRLGHERPPSLSIDLDLEPGVARDVVVPDVGDGRRWQVGIDFGDARRRIVVCATLADD